MLGLWEEEMEAALGYWSEGLNPSAASLPLSSSWAELLTLNYSIASCFKR